MNRDNKLLDLSFLWEELGHEYIWSRLSFESHLWTHRSFSRPRFVQALPTVSTTDDGRRGFQHEPKEQESIRHLAVGSVIFS